MSDSQIFVPPLGTLKQQAKFMRTDLTEDGISVTHSKSLEILAHQYWFIDWNGLYAAAQKNSIFTTLRVGQTINGVYLGQKFVGEVIGLQKLAASGRYRLSLQLDEPIDVVTFDSFSNMRRRIVCRVDEGGISTEKTSDGQPQMVLGGII